MTGSPETTAHGRPVTGPAHDAPRSHPWRAYVWWSVLAGVLALAALCCWFVGRPWLEVKAALNEAGFGYDHTGTFSPYRDLDAVWLRDESAYAEEAERRLGGSLPALRKLRLYLALPARMCPHRDRAAYCMAFSGRPAVRPLARMLFDDDAEVRKQSAHGLLLLGPEADRAVPALILALGDTEPDPPRAACRALAAVGPAAVPRLVEALGGDSAQVRTLAAVALGRIGPPARDAANALCKALDDADAGVRLAAATALVRIGAEPDSAVPVIAAVLETGNPLWRWRAARALGEAGPAAAKAVTALEKALNDESTTVRAAAADALKRIRGEKNP